MRQLANIDNCLHARGIKILEFTSCLRADEIVICMCDNAIAVISFFVSIDDSNENLAIFTIAFGIHSQIINFS